MEKSLIEQKMKFILLLRSAKGVSRDRGGKKSSTENSTKEKAGLGSGRRTSGISSICGDSRITFKRMTLKEWISANEGCHVTVEGRNYLWKNPRREKAGLGLGRRNSGVPSMCGDSRITSKRMTHKEWNFRRLISGIFVFELGLNFLKISQKYSTQIGFYSST
ncbi:hypothetical protein CEXT_627141 [Caerostris extrusa]|uniref:Uncharacterized protein n=1 Tax=Caerostris extrusa TaxID=172846 RepID=A0AAV4WZW3_CAEEX|nr:hypothetical protein CEXT_627141 [Caerostris extrusa]